jgi:hypothetical protein
MSTAVVEKPVTAPVAAPVVETPEPPEWQMPAIRAGMEVFWHKHGVRVPKHPPEIAIVQKVWRKSVDLRTLAGMPILTVRHLEDPLLEQNPEVRKDGGAWEYTEEHVGRIKDMADLKERVSKLEVHVAQLLAKKA